MGDQSLPPQQPSPTNPHALIAGRMLLLLALLLRVLIVLVLIVLGHSSHE
jgi:hypothetical protein